VTGKPSQNLGKKPVNACKVGDIVKDAGLPVEEAKNHQ
jgi:hypothetical protein